MRLGEQEFAMLAHALGLLVRLPLLIAVLHFDTKRLPEAQQLRAWPEATLWSAPSLIGPLALSWHAWRTRRGVRGVGLGLAALALELALWSSVLELLHALLVDA